MSKDKISKEAKKFREHYEIGKVHLPSIARAMYLIREYVNKVGYDVINSLFEGEGYFFNHRALNDQMFVGKDGIIYVELNSPVPIIKMKPVPTNAIIKNFLDSKNLVQYVQRSTELFVQENHESSTVQLPDGFDITDAPEESLFQTSLLVQDSLLNGSATWMGLRDANFRLCDLTYYGHSLYLMKRLDDASTNVLGNLREFKRDK